MPFGISSAPKVFHRRMHELIEGLKGVEVVADDFVVIGFGDTIEKAVAEHDKNRGGLLSRCEQHIMKLNPAIQTRQVVLPRYRKTLYHISPRFISR